MPKFLRTLKFQQKEAILSIASFSKSIRTLLYLGKILKYCRSIDLQKLTWLEDLTSSEFEKLAKVFKSLKCLRLPLSIDQVNFDFWTILFKYCKNLTSLASPLNRMNPVKAFKKKKNLQEIDLTLAENNINIPFAHYPSSLQKITIQCRSKSSEPFEIEDLIEYNQAFSHLKNLKHLDLKIAMHPLELSYMLSSIPNPNDFQSLRIYTGNLYRSSSQSVSHLAKSLKTFKNLKKLKIHLLNSDAVFGTLESFQNLLSLKSFELITPLSNEAELSFRGSLLGTLKSLNKLVIKLESSVYTHIPDIYTSFFQQISNLTQLKVLEFHLENKNEGSNKYGGSKVLSALSDCINKLQYLKELSFQYQKKLLSSSIAILTQVLNKNCQNLTRFELDLLPVEIEYKHFAAFLQVLNSMKKLEVLALSGLQLKNEFSCEDLFKTIIGFQNLSKIVLNNEIIIQRQVLIDMITKIALKKNTRTINLNGTLHLTGPKSEKNRLTLEEIQTINPKLIHFSIHSKLKSSFIPPLNS